MSISQDQIQQLVNDWTSIDPNPDTRKEVNDLFEKKQYDKLISKLYPRIAFGTAGLRSSMESGFAHMNDVTVLQASQGLVAFLISKFEHPSIVVGYDHRYHSQRFGEILASVALLKGLTVYYLGSTSNLSKESIELSKTKFENDGNAQRDYVHTPIVPFAIDTLKASGGVMITASHNPANDNGYKVYYNNGCQIIPPIDADISKSIDNNLNPWSDQVWNITENFLKGLKNGSLNVVRDEIIEQYVQGVKDKLLKDDELKFKFVYTPMHGVGLETFEKCMNLFSKKDYSVVLKQAKTDPAFPTVSFPNPEEKGALDLAMEQAANEHVPLVIANDPDADRFSCAVVDKNGKFKQLTGNEIGFLFAMYIIENTPKSELSKTYLLNSTVSSQILKSMADKDGFKFLDTLTGFKWIGNKSIDLIKEGNRVPFAFEEAIGFMFDLIHDKDGVSAAVVFLQLYQKWFGPGDTNVFDKLEEGYRKYGWFKDLNGYYRLNDLSLTNKIFEEVRKSYYPNDYPKSIGDFEVETWRDLTVGYDSSTPNHKPNLPSDPHSQMITAVLKPKQQPNDDPDLSVRFTCRGSGTEPKIKIYVEGKSTVGESDAIKIADDCWETLKKFWFKPSYYGLQEMKP
ncbi:uncharacterized protein KGF55_000361 [Candida pseudojiufengensis]|uniref:uncharacterized protein n=1 Tax=Candida pseudojiufengensis TaxID=497109 RepID=UPI00222443AF|nr:uncharacterized protein KGF55_000361 [Candida pseudojiufengensis]KAI5966952.1 hypothetical protein KGF55_000361 [Candida pseudojiufengensis]